MTEKSDVVITFRLPVGSAERLTELARSAPRLAGSPEPSRHQLARSMVLEALDGRERITKSKIIEAIGVLRRLISNGAPYKTSVDKRMTHAATEPLGLLVLAINNDDYLDAQEGAERIDGLLDKVKELNGEEEC